MTQKTYQVFSDMKELDQFILDLDPIKEFESVKREINWTLVTRECQECGEPYEQKHIAQHFCEKCQKKSEKHNKRESVSQRMKKNPSVAQCVDCHSDFYKIAPTMYYCSDCSTTGGQLVSTGEYIEVKTPMMPRPRYCVECNKRFYKTAPGMRCCKCCSPKGGELVEEEKDNFERTLKVEKSKSNVLKIVK
ncbi:hypothetical protein WKH56_10250 [Priestia sp. SB1]|uniref:hypothetical protein n=1 Tax=Priestia sp. SB1 TaxID=3132359 RepID=UPI003173EC82